MKFYQIQDLNSGCWYRLNQFGESWIYHRDEASVWTTRHYPVAIRGQIINYNKGRIVPREPVIQSIDPEAGIRVLRDLFAIRDLGDFHDEIRGSEIGTIEDGETERKGDTERWCDAVDRAKELLKE